MPAPLSLDLRERLVEAVENGSSIMRSPSVLGKPAGCDQADAAGRDDRQVTSMTAVGNQMKQQSGLEIFGSACSQPVAVSFSARRWIRSA